MKAVLRRLTLGASAASITSLVYASAALAQSFAGPTPNLPGTPAAADEGQIRTIITDIITAILNFLALIAVVIIVVAGIRLIVSQGEDDAKDKAKKTIFYALVGLIIVLFARVIVGLVTVYLSDQVA
jgi:hypothetical protein